MTPVSFSILFKVHASLIVCRPCARGELTGAAPHTYFADREIGEHEQSVERVDGSALDIELNLNRLFYHNSRSVLISSEILFYFCSERIKVNRRFQR